MNTHIRETTTHAVDLTSPLSFRSRQRAVFVLLWICYAGYYLGRANFAPALPLLIKDFGMTRTAAGTIGTALFWAYAAGQFINGHLGDRRSARTFIGLGLFVSALLNFGMTLCTSVVGLAIIWGANGFVQSNGWPLTVKTVAHWYPTRDRGRMGGILATSYIFGSAVSVALAGTIASALGWRWAFLLPAAGLMLLASAWWWKGSDSPESEGYVLPDVQATSIDRERCATPSSGALDHRAWMMAAALCALNLVRFGFMTWAPLYLFETQHASISRAAWSTAIFPAAGALGALAAGYVSDYYSRGQRAPVTTTALAGTAVLVMLYRFVLPTNSWLLGLVVLASIGFFLFGAHALIVTAAPMDIGIRKKTSSATGFIDGWGYVGAGLEGFGTGWLVDRFGWDAGFYLWVAGAVAAALITGSLWAYEYRRTTKIELD